MTTIQGKASWFARIGIGMLICLWAGSLWSQTNAPSTPNPSPPPAMSLDQFQQWLQSNGRTKSSSANAPPSQMASPSQQTTKTETIVSHPSRHQTHPLRRSAGNQRMGKPLTYEEEQDVMLHSTPGGRLQPPADAAAAFLNLLQQNMPLSPQQVVQLHQQIDVAQRAAATPPNIPPKPVSTTLMVNLAPGTTPPAIRLAQGYVSSLVFVDSTGAPWPIASFDIGNPKAVGIQWDGKSNILILQAISAYSDGDIVVRLVGLPTPITLELVSGQRVVDYRADIHVSGIGPNTKELPMGSSLPLSANQLLLSVLDGVAPPGSRSLTVRGADCQAWLLGETMYLRTRLTVLSPGWMSTMVSPDGMHAYELPKTSSVLVSRYGEPAELRVEGF